MDCIFCRIVAGEIPCHRVAENDDALAFLDIEPASTGHTLVIPKRHSADLLDIDPDSVAAVARMAKQVARQIEATLHPDGINALQNSRPAAGQVVMHYHVHLIPRWSDDSLIKLARPTSATKLDLNEIAAQLRAAAR